MKKFGATVAGAMLLLASQSQAATWDFAGVLEGTQEVPIPNLSTATGSVTGTLDDETNSFSWLVQYSSLTGGGANGGHFHQGAVGVNGPILIDFTDQILFDTSGSANGVSILSDADENLLLANGLYVNIHNAEFPGGEIRGQVVLVPEPETWLMLTLGALGVGAAARRKLRRPLNPG